MKVFGYCIAPIVDIGHFPHEEDRFPVIPEGLLTEDGYVWKDKIFPITDVETFRLKETVDITDKNWLGMEIHGNYSIISSDEEPIWRVSQASQALEKSLRQSKDGQPLSAVYSLHAAANLIGIQFSSLLSSLAKMQKSPDEPIEITVHALAQELEKSRPRNK